MLSLGPACCLALPQQAEKPCCRAPWQLAFFFCHLDAPLTSLSLGGEGLHDTQPISPADAAGAGHLLQGLAKFTQPRCLNAVLPADECLGRDRDCSLVANDVRSVLPGLSAALHQLLSLTIPACPAAVQRIMPQLATTTLTQLHKRRVNWNGASDEFLLCGSDLKLWDLSLLSWASSMAAQSSLTQLTSVWLCGGRCLKHGVDWQVLVDLTRLQALSLGEGFAAEHDGRLEASPGEDARHHAVRQTV